MSLKLSTSVQGNVSRSRQISGFTLTDTLFDSGLTLPKHAHENAHFCLLLEGAFTEVCGRQTLECKPMSLSFLGAGESHTDYFHSKQSRCFIIDIAPRWIERAREHNLEFGGAANFQGGLASHIALKIQNEFYRKDSASPLAIEGLVLEMMAEAARHPVNDPDRLVPPGWKEPGH